jgi:hypothetical protein
LAAKVEEESRLIFSRQMELLLFRPEEFERQYNCSRLKVDDVPLAKRVDVLNGLILLTLFYTMEVSLK